GKNASYPSGSLCDRLGCASARRHTDERRAAVMLAPGLVAERYEIRRLLGTGGMGQVYLAVDQLLRRQVALKLFPMGASPNAAEAFLREARMAARLAHPNVVTVHDVGTAGQNGFIAMEYVEGQSLGELIDAPQPWPEVLAVAREILKGL